MVGDALDIGAGSDGLGRQIGIWPLLRTVSEWDVPDGDAQSLVGVAASSFDLVISSHCLEHVQRPFDALERWFKVVKPGGHLVVTVPDFAMYEREQWPSRFNADHKSYFVLGGLSGFPDINLLELVASVHGEIIKIERIVQHFDPSLPKDYDQTQGLAECAIEFIVRKPE